MWSFIILFFIAWIISPIVFIPIVISLKSTNKNLKSEVDFYKRELHETKQAHLGKEFEHIQHTDMSAPTNAEEIQSTEENQFAEETYNENASEFSTQPVIKTEIQIPQNDTVQTASVPQTKKQNPYNYSVFKDEERDNKTPANMPPYDMPYVNGYSNNANVNNSQNTNSSPYSSQPVSYEKPHKTVSTINIVLIMGAVFIILAEIIFASTSWDFMPDFLRAGIILSISAIFFGVSSLAERKLELNKTGLAFYTIGSFSLPITMFSVGYFELFGKWFSLFGDGKFLLISVIFALLSAVCVKGSCDYKNKQFSFGALFSLSAAVSALILQFTTSINIFILVTAIYSLVLIMIAPHVFLKQSERFDTLYLVFEDFASINSIIFSAIALFSVNFNGLSFVAMMIFSCCYLRTIYVNESGFVGAVPFSAFAATAIIRLISPETSGEIMLVVMAVSILILVMSLMNVLGEELQKAFKWLSIFAVLSAAVICLIFIIPHDFNSSDNLSIWSLLAVGMLAANTAYIMLRDDTIKHLDGLFTVTLIMLVNISARLVSGTFEVWSFITCIGILIIAGMIKLLGEHRFRGMLTDLVLIVSMVLFTAFTFSGRMTDAFSVTTTLAIIMLSALFFIMSADKITVKNLRDLCRFCVPFSLSLIMFTVRNMPFVANAVWQNMFQNGFLSNELYYMICTVLVLTILISSAFYCMHLASKKDENIVWENSLTFNFFAIGIMLLFVNADYTASMIIFAFFALYCIIRGVIDNRAYSREFYIAGTILSTIFSLILGKICVENLNMNDYSPAINRSLVFLFPSFMAIILCIIHVLVPKFRYSKETFLAGNITLAVFTAVYSFTLTDYYGEVHNFIWIFYAVILLAGFFFAYKSKFTVHMILPMILVFPFLCVILPDNDWGDFSILCAVFVLMLIASRVLHKKIIDGCFVDIFTLTSWISIIAILANTDNKYISFLVALMAALVFLNPVRMLENEYGKNVMVMLSSLCVLAAWFVQPFIVFAGKLFLIKTEFYVVGVLIFLFCMRFVWKNHLKALDNVSFAAIVVMVWILCKEALRTEMVTDTIIILSGVLVMLLFALKHKRKKWFFLSVSTTIIMTLIMSGNFWASMLWWVYLMATGIMLITIGVRSEIKRRNMLAEDSENEELIKAANFLSDWEW